MCNQYSDSKNIGNFKNREKDYVYRILSRFSSGFFHAQKLLPHIRKNFLWILHTHQQQD